MKLCYCDESGTGDEPIAVMVGIVVDAHRMHVTKEHWAELLVALSRVVGRSIDEIHTRDFYAGNGVWRGMKGPERSQVISEVFNWIDARRHHIVYSSVEKSAYYTSLKAGQVPSELATPWRFMECTYSYRSKRFISGKRRTRGIQSSFSTTKNASKCGLLTW